MTTWLVTGASGFLGSNLGHALAGHGRRIGASRTPPAAGLFDAWTGIDLRDPSAIAQLVARERPDVVVNTAAAASHQGCEENPALATALNVDAAASVAAATASVGARLVHISTDAVFDGARGNYRETDEPNPFGIYGRTKLDGERAVLEAHPAAIIARTNFFGWSPSGTRSILEFFVNALTEDEPVNGFTDFVVTSLYAQHLAGLLIELAATDVHGVVHVASSDALSKYDFGITVAECFGLDASLITPIAGSLGPDGLSRTRDLSLDTTLLTELVGHRPATQRAGIEAASRDADLRRALAFRRA